MIRYRISQKIVNIFQRHVENKAIDRVHRIGQTRGVQVFKLITKGTLEEKIDAMITTKATLMNSVVESDDAVFKSFSRKELIELLTF